MVAKLGDWNSICSSCNQLLPLEKFSTRTDTGKFRKQCKVCRASVVKLYQITTPRKSHKPTKEAASMANKKWRLSHLAYDAQRQRERTALKLRAIPSWINKDKVKELYLNRPEGFHVDHIIPLKGEKVCGLHWEGNLQYLPALENIRKKNYVQDVG